MKYRFIDSNRGRFSVEKMAYKLGVSVSSYYEYKSCKYVKREVNRFKLEGQITCYFNESNQRYGSRRLSAELKSHGIRASHTTTAKYMQRLGLRSRHYPKFRQTTDSKHSNPIAENLLDRKFKVSAPNKVWVSDITYIAVEGGFEYLTVIIDLYDRKVVGYHQSRSLKAIDTVIPAFRMAVKRRLSGKSALGLIFHSDRGVQYTCKEFVDLLAEYKMVRSNSRKGNCWDNAVAESFFKSLKCELVYRFKRLITSEIMRTEVFCYIEAWYNRRRRHSALGNLTIEEFYKHKMIDSKKLKTAS